jgi:hypothetical protein
MPDRKRLSPGDRPPKATRAFTDWMIYSRLALLSGSN